MARYRYVKDGQTWLDPETLTNDQRYYLINRSGKITAYNLGFWEASKRQVRASLGLGWRSNGTRQTSADYETIKPHTGRPKKYQRKQYLENLGVNPYSRSGKIKPKRGKKVPKVTRSKNRRKIRKYSRR